MLEKTSEYDRNAIQELLTNGIALMKTADETCKEFMEAARGLKESYNLAPPEARHAPFNENEVVYQYEYDENGNHFEQGGIFMMGLLGVKQYRHICIVKDIHPVIIISPRIWMIRLLPQMLVCTLSVYSS